MTTNSVLDPESVEGSELVKETFAFWFSDNEHIRSPFPAYIRNELQQIAKQRFFDWAKNLNSSAKDEMNDEMIGEKFEEIIFDAATQLVKTDDEKITILYPFLPRSGDKLLDVDNRSGIVNERQITKDGDKSYLLVKLVRDDKSKWETSFELPM